MVAPSVEVPPSAEGRLYSYLSRTYYATLSRGFSVEEREVPRPLLAHRLRCCAALRLSDGLGGYYPQREKNSAEFSAPSARSVTFFSLQFYSLKVKIPLLIKRKKEGFSLFLFFFFI